MCSQRRNIGKDEKKMKDRSLVKFDNIHLDYSCTIRSGYIGCARSLKVPIDNINPAPKRYLVMISFKDTVMNLTVSVWHWTLSLCNVTLQDV